MWHYVLPLGNSIFVLQDAAWEMTPALRRISCGRPQCIHTSRGRCRVFRFVMIFSWLWDIFRLRLNGFRLRKHWFFMIYLVIDGFVGVLLPNRFGQTDMPGLSTARDLFISAIISGMFFVQKIIWAPTILGNIAIFGSRSAEQASIGYCGSPIEAFHFELFPESWSWFQIYA